MKAAAAASLVTLLLAFALPVSAQHGGHSCPHPGATIADLQACVAHAATMGHIDNAGTLRSLQSKLDAAQAASERGQADVAVNLLEALVRAVGAQAGKHIDAGHAEHMIQHAERVIAALG